MMQRGEAELANQFAPLDGFNDEIVTIGPVMIPADLVFLSTNQKGINASIEISDALASFDFITYVAIFSVLNISVIILAALPFKLITKSKKFLNINRFIRRYKRI